MTAPRIQTAADLKLKAFSAGFRDALNGKNADQCPYHTSEMQSSWLAGFKEFEEKKGKQNESRS